MSSFFDQFEAQLRSAAQARVPRNEDGAAALRRRRRPPWLRAVPVLASVLVVLVVVGGALVLLGHRGHGTPSPSASPPSGGGVGAIIANTPRRQLRRELSYINIATHQAQRTHPRLCNPPAQPQGSFIHGSPGQAVLSILGVLRRPQTPADRRGTQSFSGVPDVYVGSIRRAFAADGVTYYIAVTRNNPSGYQPSPRCFAFEVAALHAYLRKIPVSLRSPTLRLQWAFISFDTKLLTSGPRQTICTDAVSRNAGGSGCGLTASEIAAGIQPSDDSGTFNGIVPDRVATVTVVWRPPHGVQRSATGPVLGNMYAIRGGPANGPVTVVRVIWRAAQGQVIKTISQPSARAVARYCRQHPVTCLAVSGEMTESTSSSSGAGFSGTSSAPPTIQESSSSATATSASPAPSGSGG